MARIRPSWTPGSTDSSSEITLGHRWSASTAVSVIGIWWYRPSGGSTSVVVKLYDHTTETVLTSAEGNSLSLGWNLIEFSSPYEAQSGTNYVSAVEAVGTIAYDLNQLNSAITDSTYGLVTIPANGGTYAFGWDVFPNNFGTYMHGVDTEFEPGAPPTTPHKVSDRGSVQNKTSQSSTNVTMSNGGSVSLGNYLVARVVADNAGTDGAAVTLGITDPRGNTWTILGPANRDPGAANAGVTAWIAYTKVDNAYSNSDAIAFGYSGTNVSAKAIVVEEWENIHDVSPVAVAATTTNGGSTTPSISQTPIAADQLFYGVIGVEGPSGDTFNQDTDTVDGNWSSLTRLGTTGGTADGNVTNNGVSKLVSGTATQTWNPTLGTSRDWAAVALIFAALSDEIIGTLDIAIPQFVAVIQGEATISGEFAAELPMPEVVITGQVVDTLSAVMAVELPLPEISATGNLIVTGVVAVSLPELSVSFEGIAFELTTGELSIEIPLPVVDIAVGIGIQGQLEVVLPIISVELDARVPIDGTLDIVLPLPTFLVGAALVTSEPFYSDTTERIYQALPAVYRAEDRNFRFTMKRFIAAIADQLGEVDTLYGRFDYTPPEDGVANDTSDLVDPATADVAWLRWLAQLVGVRLRPQETVQDHRQKIKSALSSSKAGTLSAIAEAAKHALTGSKTVTVYRRSNASGIGAGSEWEILIITRADETVSDPIQAVIEDGAKPAGALLYHLTAGATWDAIESEHPTWADWDQLTWDEFEQTGL